MSESNIIENHSYPPIFRSPFNDTTRKLDLKDEQGEGAESTGTLDPLPLPLPLIDFQCLDDEKLDTACKEWGIFRLENHGVPSSLLRQLQEHAKTLFRLPFEAKQGLAKRCPIKYFWGTPALTSSGVALLRTSDALNMDWVEGLNVPVSQLHQHLQHIHHDPLINDFRDLLEDYRGHLTRIASTLFEAMINNLKLDLQQVKPCLDESTGLIRVYRYPRHTINEHVKGLHEHTDSSIISILSEDQVGGLQLLKDDKWLKVEPIPNTLVVNLGDMMQVLSDDEYKSVKHKVELNKNKERVSIGYFVFPEENTLINSSKYKPFSYNQFRAQVQQDIKLHGTKIGLQNFKLPHTSQTV
ncbi:hypothetical protein SOVF_033940 [Spinacia oleracea]|nr:hypothetical protein SOVF_033940 [Spinacia oleracea]